MFAFKEGGGALKLSGWDHDAKDFAPEVTLKPEVSLTGKPRKSDIASFYKEGVESDSDEEPHERFSNGKITKKAGLAFYEDSSSQILSSGAGPSNSSRRSIPLDTTAKKGGPMYITSGEVQSAARSSNVNRKVIQESVVSNQNERKPPMRRASLGGTMDSSRKSFTRNLDELMLGSDDDMANIQKRYSQGAASETVAKGKQILKMAEEEDPLVYGSRGSSIALSRVMSDDMGSTGSKKDIRNDIRFSRTEDVIKKSPSEVRFGYHEEFEASEDEDEPTNGLDDDESVADVIQAIGRDNGWTDAEIIRDTMELMKNRLRTVRDLRRMTPQGWAEIPNLLPITKDLLRQVIRNN
jgi:hypothetical protein